MFWLVDSAGARITDQVELFPGRRGAGRIFYNQVRLSGRVPQICCLFGPSRRRRRLHPVVLRHRDHGRGQRLDVPRLAAHGRDGDRREGHARGDGRRPHARHGVGLRRQPRRRRRRRHRPGQGLVHLPARHAGATQPPALRAGAAGRAARPPTSCPPSDTQGYDMHDRHRRPRRRRELLRGQAAVRPRAGRAASACSTAARSASWPTTRWHKGGVLFVDSADKAARFIWCCDAFNIPLVFLADVPGFMIGTAGRARRASSATAPR